MTVRGWGRAIPHRASDPRRASVPAGRLVVCLGAILLVAACGRPGASPEDADSSPGGHAASGTVARSAASASAATPTPPSRGPTPTPAPPECDPATPAPTGPSLVGDTRNTWAFAPLSDPGRVVVEGNVPSQRAWSTSKVLVVAAFLATVADGDPARLTAQQARWIDRALTESDMASLLALRGGIPGGSGAPMNAILRSVGDTQTRAPNTREGTMPWTVRNQVRFMAALAAGRVVNAQVSRYILTRMHPVSSQSWGLGTVGATAVKGGWLRPDTETRQMGVLDGYAVSLLTAGVGPAVWQSDGDAAHVRQLNRLAALLKERLEADRGGAAASPCP